MVSVACNTDPPEDTAASAEALASAASAASAASVAATKSQAAAHCPLCNLRGLSRGADRVQAHESEAQAEAARLRAELQQSKTDLAASQQRVLALSLITASPAPPNGGAGADGGSGDDGTGRASSCGRAPSPTTSLVRSLSHEEAHLVLGKIAHLTSSLNQLVVGSAASVLEQTRPT